MSKRKRFSEVVDWDKHIEPYRLVQFTAGVGSGKNHWVENDLMLKKRVLLITSRKAKVKETEHKLGICSKIDLNAFKNRDKGLLLGDEALKYQNCICNNSHIENYWKYKFDPNDRQTFLWEYFDVIVIDEAHSLATDATFSDAPFHLYSFLNYVFQQKTVKLIFMTATPNPILDIVHTKNKKQRKLWDFTNECINVKPPRIDIDTQEHILQEIVDIYQNGKGKVVYFVNLIKSIKTISEELIKMGIPENVIAVSYSKNNGSVSLREKIKDSKNKTQKYLKIHEDLPEDKFILISTSRNKEGINIDNPETHWYMYTESHYNDECNQMWGRVRAGLEKFTIDYFAQQHPAIYCEREPQYLLSLNALEVANQTLEEWCFKNKERLPNYKTTFKDLEYSNLSDCIEAIEDRLDFVRFDVIKKDFVWYKEKIIGCRNHAQNTSNFKAFVQMRLGKTNLSVGAPFTEFSCKIHSSVAKASVPKKELTYNEKNILLIKYIVGNKLLNGSGMSENEVGKLREFIFELGITQKNGKPYKNLNKVLTSFGFEYVKGHHKGDLPRIERIEK